MKTVIDAVNKLKGIWNPCDSMMVCNQKTASISNWLYSEPISLLATPEWSVLCTREEFNQCVEDCSNNFGKSKPVYTQAMKDNGEQVPLGVDCLWGGHNYNYVPCKILCIDDSQFFMLVDGVHGIVGNPTNFKPLTPPKTDNEKAFDKFLSDDYSSTREDFSKSESDRDFIEGLESAFNAGIKLAEVKSNE